MLSESTPSARLVIHLKLFGEILLCLCCFYLVSDNAIASDVTFAQEYVSDGINYQYISSVLEVSGGYVAVGCDASPILLRLNSDGTVHSSLNYKITTHPRACFLKVIQAPNQTYTAIGLTQAPQTSSPFLAHLSAQGKPIWQRIIVGAKDESLREIAQTADGGYIAVGTIRADAWMIKLSPKGIVQWARAFGSAGSDEFRYVKQLQDGSYIAGGSSDFQALIARVSTHGDLISYRRFAAVPPAHLDIASMLLVEKGDLLIGGTYKGQSEWESFLMKISPGGNVIWSRAYSPAYYGFPSIDRTRDGDYLAAGIVDFVRGPDSIGLLLKTDINGKLLWSRKAYSQLLSVHETMDNGIGIIADGVNLSGFGKTNVNGLIPGCFFLENYPIKIHAPRINPSTTSDLKTTKLNLKSIPIAMVPQSTSVEARAACH